MRSLLSGEIITVEGRANDPGNHDDIRFTAFAIASYDAEAQAYSWRAYSAGNCIEVQLQVGEGTYRWEFKAVPGVLMRFDGTVATDVWKEVGLVSTDGGSSWSQTLEMNLTRVDENEPSGPSMRPDVSKSSGKTLPSSTTNAVDR